MHHVLIILTLTFVQGHTDIRIDITVMVDWALKINWALKIQLSIYLSDRNTENNKSFIISETIQAIPIQFAVKIVRLKVYMTIASR